MRTKYEIFKGMDETLFFLKCKLSFKFFVDNVVGLPIEKHQVDWVHDVENNSRTCIIAFTGSGKCLKKGTKVIMYNSSLKNVEDVNVGDLLMGDDSTARTVLNTNSGFGKMYKVAQTNGIDYYVNEDHILSLKTHNNMNIDISINDYLKLNKLNKQMLRGYKALIGSYSTFERCKFYKSLFSEITVTEAEDAEWFGFALDRNKKFLLEDFTVTHNSECLGIWYPLWKMFITHGWQGLIVSNSMGQGTKLLERVMDMVNDNEVLIDLKGARDKENSTQFNTRNRCKLFCMPNTKNVKSVHVDYVLADEASAYDDHDVFFRFVETRANAKQGRLCAISTLTSPDDLMSKLRDNPAYKTIITSCYNPDGSALSKRFPLEYLDGKKLSMGIDAFRKEYECDVSMVLDAIFPPDLIISCFDNNIGFSLNKDDYEGTVYIGCDFAYSAQGDYSVFLVLDVTDTKIVIRHMERYRGMAIDEQKQRIIALNQMLDPASIVVDASNFGQGIFKDLLAEGVPVYGQNFAPINRRNILINLKTKMESGKVIIPHIEDGNTERLVDILKMELSSFKRKNTQAGFETFQAESKHDDTVFALALSIKAAENHQPFLSFMATERRPLGKNEKGLGGLIATS